jgi:phage/plasmid-like protein (TIGR03299 family)
MSVGIATALAPVTPGRRDSLHEIGTDVSDAAGTYDALASAGLTGWNVRTIPTFTADGRPIPNGRAAEATVNGAARLLGQVGKSYQPVQTEDFAALLDTLAAESGARPDVVATLYGGKRVLIGMKLPEPMRVGDDPLNVSMVAIINHLTGANQLAVVPFRVFCANQQPQINRDGEPLFVLRHTSKAADRLESAGRMVEAVGGRLAAFRGDAEKMLGQPMSEAEFLARTAKLFPRADGDSKVGATRFENRQAALRRLFVEEPTQESIRWTAWGGFQAVVEYLDHYAVTRRGSDEAAAGVQRTGAQRRAIRSLSGAATPEKLRAMAAFLPDPTAVTTTVN